ncbi:hypothetical protein BJX70DRAFT_209079 [Aspergillus crustosus]
MRKRKPSEPKPSQSPPQLPTATPTQLLAHLSKPKNLERIRLNPSTSLNHTTKRQRKYAPAGIFEFLPPEILDMVLLSLDYASLGRLCSLNSKVEVYIKSRPWYKLALEHCSSALKIMGMVKLLRIHNAGAISSALFNPQCCTPGCGNLSNNLFLPTCRRYCYDCLGTSPLSSALCSWFVEEYGIGWEECKANMFYIKSPSTEYPRSEFAMEEDVIEYAGRKYSKARIIPGPQKARFWSELAAVPFPFVDTETRAVEIGRRCRACYETPEVYTLIETQISIEPTPEQRRSRTGRKR